MNDFGQRLHHVKPNSDYTGWLKFRKYDGHSAIWLPQTQDLEKGISGLWSLGRSNKPEAIAVPNVWLKYMPMNVALHGELWHPEDRPQLITSACKNKPVIDEWMPLQFIVFGFPNNSDLVNPLDESTYRHLETGFRSWLDARDRCKYVLEIENRVVRFPEPVEDMEPSWEGLVYQNPEARYVNGRTYQCLKFKPEYDDEAIVVGYEAGKTGVRVGTCGGIRVEYTLTEKLESVHGFIPLTAKSKKVVSFVVSGLTESEWTGANAEAKYPVGSTLSFKFLSLSNNNVPMHCSINREVHT